MARLFVVSLLVVLAACGAAPSSGPSPRGGRGHARRVRGEPRVGAYVSSAWGFSTASYWIEGPTGLVVIDTQFLPSAAEELLDAAERETGKRARLAIVLHANPDKYNGAGVMRRRGVRVVSAEQVVRRIPEIDVERRRSFAARYAPDYPERLVVPESFGSATRELEAGGVRLRAHVLGPGCSNAHVVVQWDAPDGARHVFGGDLLANRTHAWLKEADVDGWLARVAEMQALSPRFVHPGRGESDGPALLARQADYLRFVQARIAEAEPRLPVDDAVVARIRDAVEARFSGYAFAVFLRIGLREEYRRAASVRAGRTTATP